MTISLLLTVFNSNNINILVAAAFKPINVDEKCPEQYFVLKVVKDVLHCQIVPPPAYHDHTISQLGLS